MSWKSSISFLALMIAMPASCVLGPLAGHYTNHHNKVRRTENSIEFTKIDGVWSAKTEITINDKGIRIKRDWFEEYLDYDKDGLVDRVSATYDDSNGAEFRAYSFERKEKYTEFKWFFDIADKKYQEQLERFEPLIKKHEINPPIIRQKLSLER